MKSAYIDYAMSVIVSRALPDVRDGLKPVHRRVLYGMNELGLAFNKSHKKSARIVGEVLGKYHPHGDTSVYDAMVRMAQEWSLRYMLVDGQGNYGSVDGDSPAAMRYTEAKLRRISDEILADIDKNTVDFALNFDDTLEEPTVLPSKIPNLLINGATGIAVGMATNMLPHNLTEVIDGVLAYMANEEIAITDLMQHIKAPDFPTGGTIYGLSGVRQAYETGRGRVVVRGNVDYEETASGKTKIIANEIPYQVNKAVLIKKTADLINDKKIEGISDIRDESDRNGMRIVYELKRDANAQVVLNQLYRYTSLQTSFGINNVCLVKGRPRLLNLKELIVEFVEFRHEIVVRRTQYELEQAEKKAHILEGLIIAVDNLDEVIKIIRGSATPDEAKQGLIAAFELSEIQAKAILEMRLQKLTGLEIDKLRKEYGEIMELIGRLKAILADKGLRTDIILGELTDIRERYGDERRTELTIDDSDISMEDIIDDEPVVVTISRMGYIKRTSLEEYREQGRGGKGSKGGGTRDEDFIENLFVATAHNYMLLFTEKGRCYWMRVYQVPEGTKTSKGRAIQNIIQLPKDDKVLAYINVKDLGDEEFVKNHFVVFATRNGVIKKTSLESFARPRSNGINAITIREEDRLVECRLTNGQSEILIASSFGKTIRFNETKVRSMGRTAAGVRGIKLGGADDFVVGMICIDTEAEEKLDVLVVSEKGYGKRSDLEEYRETNRGGKGVKTMNVTDKTGKLVAIKDVSDHFGLMIINKSGIIIRMAVATVSKLGRATQGVRLIKLNEKDEIASVARITENYDEAEEVIDEAIDSGNPDAAAPENQAKIEEIENKSNNELSKEEEE
ncbi:UNVERIFIED_CONTAM: hypothetical protein GTU68_018980 [Idotea baltica]|nr:hypothetical protein [Idotea baltica]